MRNVLRALLLTAGSALAAPAAMAQATPPAGGAKPPNEQVIEPAVPRRDVRVPKIPNRDFIVGAFVGTYSQENFGANLVYGARLGYHITEDFFVEAAFGATKVSDESFRQILPGGVFVNETEKLSYYNLSVGYNILPGEVFIGRNTAKASQFYLIGGVGSTKFIDQKRQTFNVGFGSRFYFTDKMAVQVDMRDHIFSLDLLGKRQSTQNLELSAGFTYFF
jgi:outer membrane beta-barrel protein